MSVSVASCRRLCYPSIKGDDTMPTPQEVWAMLQAHEGETFYTAKGLPFHYLIHGRELFVNRKKQVHHHFNRCQCPGPHQGAGGCRGGNHRPQEDRLLRGQLPLPCVFTTGHHPSAADKRRTTAINCRRITGCITCYALFACFVQKSAKMSKAYNSASYK